MKKKMQRKKTKFVIQGCATDCAHPRAGRRAGERTCRRAALDHVAAKRRQLDDDSAAASQQQEIWKSWIGMDYYILLLQRSFHGAEAPNVYTMA